MNISQRITILERQTATAEPAGTPIKPMDWTDGEYTAVVKGLGLMGANILTLSEPFIAKYKTHIDTIRAYYNERDITPDQPIIRAKALSFNEVIDYQRAKYFDD
jgi:hypothetical protein